MKVPIYDQPQAEARADVPAGVNIQQSDNSALERGIERGADALGKGIDQERYDKWKHEARSADVANALADYSNDATDKFHGAPQQPDAVDAFAGPDAKVVGVAVPPGDMASALPPAQQVDTGFLGTRGKAAAAAEQPLFDSLKQRRDQIAAGLSDPETKKLFLARVQQLDGELRQKAASHVGQQVVVEQQDAANNISDAALRGAAADPADDKLAAHLFGEAVGAVHALTADEEFKALHERQLRAEMADVRIDSLLAPDGAGNISRAHIDKAQEILDNHRTVLGDKLRPLEQRINIARKGDDKQELDNAAEVEAQAAMKDAVDPLTGHIDEAKLWTRVDQVPDVKERDLVRQRARTRLVEQEAVFRHNTDTLLATAHAEYNRVGSVSNMSAQTLQTLNNWPDKEAPAMLDAFMAKDRERFRLSRSSRAEANKEQREANEEALRLYESQGSDLNSQPESVDKFLGMFPKSVNDLGRSALVLAQRKATNIADKGLAITEQRFVRETLAQLKDFRPTDPKEATAWRAKATADAVNAYAAAAEEADGKEPNKEATEKLRAQIVGDYWQEALKSGDITDERAAAAAGAAAILGGGSRRRIGKIQKGPPNSERQQAYDALAKQGLRNIDEDMVTNYLKRKASKAAAPIQGQKPTVTTLKQMAQEEAAGDYGLDLTTHLPETPAAEDLP